MLHRHDPAGFTVITQPAHAWLAGQLARAWGNTDFGALSPREEVCLAAEQHDIAWLSWEQSPTLNAATGRPHTFIELPVAVHVPLWTTAAPLALVESRYAALLVSLHGSGLYQRRDVSGDSPDEQRLIAEFIQRAHAFETRMIAQLRADPNYAPHASAEAVARNRKLVAAWDYISLVVCMGLRGEKKIPHVPTAVGDTELVLRAAGGMTEIDVSPWPFASDSVSLSVEGRRLPGTFTREQEMRAALAAAEWVTIVTRLRREAHAECAPSP